MDLYTSLIILHAVGAALGVGGATLIEAHIGKALRDGKMSPDERALLGSDFFLTRVGLALTILTGIGFIYIYYSTNTLFRLENGIFWAKMLMVVIIGVNAYLLHKHKISLYWGSALSFVTWWVTFLIGLFLTNGVKIYPQDQLVSFGIVMVGYGALIVSGAWLLHKLRERSKDGERLSPQSDAKPATKEPIVQTAAEALGRVPTEHE